MGVPLLIAAVAGSTAMSAFGAYSQGHAASEAANYNAQLAVQNAKQQKENSAIASQSGTQQTAMQSLKTRSTVGSEIADQAASGVDTKSGSALDTQISSHEIGMLDALQVRSNATRAAFGYKVAAANDEAQGELDKFGAKADEFGGEIGAASTLLGGAESGVSKYQQYKLAGGL